MRKIHLYMDGDKICATWDDFINLQESPAGFGDTIWQAFGNLIDNTPAIETNAIVTSIENAAVEDRDRASEYNNKTAVALLNELSSIKPYGRSVVSDKAYEILERWTQAQSPLLPNNGINSDSPRLRTGNPSPEGFAGYETDEPQ